MTTSLIHRAIREVRRLHGDGMHYRIAALHICKGQPLRARVIENLARQADERGEK